jgi:hypothetical protein
MVTYVLRGGLPHVNGISFSVSFFNVMSDGVKLFCNESRYFGGFVLFVNPSNFDLFYLRACCFVFCIGTTSFC